jgi:hypothetical protein
MYWRTPIDRLLSPSFATAPRVRLGDLVATIISFINPLWRAGRLATPASAGVQGDQDSHRGLRHA